MAVLVEGISVIVKRKAIDAHYPGGWSAFVADVPNRTLCADSDLARVGFMAPDDVRHFIGSLERHGLRFSDGKQAVDLAVLDQLRGPTTDCPWVEWGQVKLDEGTVSACQMAGSKDMQVACPVDWKFSGSLSEKFTFTKTEDVNRSLKFLRRENGADVYEDLATGKLVYQGRTSED